MPHAITAIRRVAAVALAVTIVASGCIVGERPTLDSTPAVAVDDPAVATVVERLERAGGGAFTATYDIIPTTTGLITKAEVVVADGREQVRIGDVDFLTDGGVDRTCVADGDRCVDYLDDARISDLNITHEFWGDAFAARLRLDGSRRVGFSEGHTTTIAEQPAVCVDIPVPGIRDLSAAVVYCALEAGVLARYFGADVSIELTSFTFADEGAADGAAGDGDRVEAG